MILVSLGGERKMERNIGLLGIHGEVIGEKLETLELLEDKII